MMFVRRMWLEIVGTIWPRLRHSLAQAIGKKRGAEDNSPGATVISILPYLEKRAAAKAEPEPAAACDAWLISIKRPTRSRIRKKG
jgi:hypothetical protein